jgi:hypothetical protein
MTDAEKLEAIEEALEPIKHYLSAGTQVPQNSIVFVKLLEALTTVNTMMTEPMVAVPVKELEELRAFKAERTPKPPVR